MLSAQSAEAEAAVVQKLALETGDDSDSFTLLNEAEKRGRSLLHVTSVIL
jgi:hypothetical protein